MEWAQVRALVADGVSERDFPRRLGINRRTVARLSGGEEPPRYRRAPVGSSSIRSSRCCGRLLAEGPHIKAPRATELLRDDYGYAGSVDPGPSSGWRSCGQPKSVRAAQRTGYRPGQVMQVDWAEMPTRPRLSVLGAQGLRADLLRLPYSGAATRALQL